MDNNTVIKQEVEKQCKDMEALIDLKLSSFGDIITLMVHIQTELLERKRFLGQTPSLTPQEIPEYVRCQILNKFDRLIREKTGASGFKTQSNFKGWVFQSVWKEACVCPAADACPTEAIREAK